MNECPPNDDPSGFDDASILTRYEPYLRMLARSKLRRAYQSKVGASDLVQQVLVQAVQGFDGFRGSSEGELMAWLRQILAHHLCHLDRDWHRDKRDIRREQSMQQRLAASSMRLEGLLAGDGPTPSQHLALGENLIRISRAIAELPDDQGDAVRLHYLEGMKLSEVADEMERTTGSVAGLLHRGMKSLRSQLAES